MTTDSDAPTLVEVNPACAATHAVIWLHGLGADGNDFTPIVPQLHLSDDTAVRFVFPHAPVRPVTINGGLPSRAWFDMTTLDRNTKRDYNGLHHSQQRIHELIRRENERGVPSERIVLAGFSQGGAVVLHTAPRYPERLAGMIALSTFCLTNDSLRDEATANNRHLPVFMAHGRHDPVVAPGLGEESRDALIDWGMNVAWNDYAMAHAVCPEEIEDIRRWLAHVLT